MGSRLHGNDGWRCTTVTQGGYAKVSEGGNPSPAWCAITTPEAQGETDRLVYGFIQKTLDVTGGNLTTHLRKLEEAGYLVIEKEFEGSKPRTWVRATPAGRSAFAEYLRNLRRALGWQPLT